MSKLPTVHSINVIQQIVQEVFLWPANKDTVNECKPAVSLNGLSHCLRISAFNPVSHALGIRFFRAHQPTSAN